MSACERAARVVAAMGTARSWSEAAVPGLLVLLASAAHAQEPAARGTVSDAAPLVALLGAVVVGVVVVLSVRAYYHREAERLIRRYRERELRAEQQHAATLARLVEDGAALRGRVTEAEVRAEDAHRAIESAAGAGDGSPDSVLLKMRERNVQIWLEHLVETLWHPDMLGVRIGPFQAMGIDRDVIRFGPFVPPIAGRRSVTEDDPADAPATDRPLSLAEVLRVATRLVFVGGPGSGKTAALRSIALTYGREKTQERFGFREARLPVYLSLAALDAQDFTKPMPEVVWRLLVRDRLDASLIEGHARAGNLIVLLDDLNLLPSHEVRDAAMRWIETTERRYPKNVYVVATRPSVYGARARFAPHFREFGVLPIADQDVDVLAATASVALELSRHEPGTRPEQVQGDASRWLVGLSSRKEGDERGPRALETPLDVSAFLLAKLVGGPPAPSASQRLGRALTALFGFRQIYGVEAHSLSDEMIGRLLCQLAFRLHSQGRYIVERGVVVSMVAELLARQATDSSAAETILSRIAHSTTLLRLLPGDRIRFVTPAVQECLAAMHLVDYPDLDLLASRIEDPYWHEVAAHVCGMRESEELVQRIAYGDEGVLALIWPAVWRCAQLTYGDEAAKGSFARRAVDALRAALGSEQRAVRMAAAHALGQLNAAGCEEVLLRALDDRHSSVRRVAVRSLLEIRSEEAIPRLVSIVGSDNEATEVRCEAALALGKLGHDGAAPVLRLAQEDSNRALREAAREALRLLAQGPGGESRA